MTYRQNKVDRGICCVCQKPFKEDEWIMDLFRFEASLPGADPRKHDLIWVHETCARRSMEKWILTKERKANAANGNTDNNGA